MRPVPGLCPGTNLSALVSHSTVGLPSPYTALWTNYVTKHPPPDTIPQWSATKASSTPSPSQTITYTCSLTWTSPGTILTTSTSLCPHPLCSVKTHVPLASFVNTLPFIHFVCFFEPRASHVSVSFSASARVLPCPPSLSSGLRSSLIFHKHISTLHSKFGRELRPQFKKTNVETFWECYRFDAVTQLYI